ncbi:glycosyltransferase family 2 protein [Metabacillus indicus]|uniref:glycosyltransferase family 2 protein n=1 Tax=Metabacillus indicus TaxID=246786 RepID=UPI0004935F46|nr:glycosyltransferase family 2 protein [Metabacillus indicus]KEZ48772.1 glycosyl transferase [Metabacillus indicus LMG 22858]
MNTPLVSVITPVYNAEKFITETIRSVQNQTYTNWEMLLVDDCSSDKSRSVIKELAAADSRIKLIEQKENGGAAVARNTAIEHASGKYAAFLDSDDAWLPEKLMKQVSFMEERKIDFSFTSYEIMDDQGNRLGQVVHAPKEMTYNKLLSNTIIGCLTVMLNLESLGKVKMVNIRTRQDYVMWLSILKKGYIAYGIDETLALYRKVPGSISSNKLKAAKQNWKVYREIEKLSLFKSAVSFTGYAINAVKKSR